MQRAPTNSSGKSSGKTDYDEDGVSGSKSAVDGDLNVGAKNKPRGLKDANGVVTRRTAHQAGTSSLVDSSSEMSPKQLPRRKKLDATPRVIELPIRPSKEEQQKDIDLLHQLAMTQLYRTSESDRSLLLQCVSPRSLPVLVALLDSSAMPQVLLSNEDGFLREKCILVKEKKQERISTNVIDGRLEDDGRLKFTYHQTKLRPAAIMFYICGVYNGPLTCQPKEILEGHSKLPSGSICINPLCYCLTEGEKQKMRKHIKECQQRCFRDCEPLLGERLVDKKPHCRCENCRQADQDYDLAFDTSLCYSSCYNIKIPRSYRYLLEERDNKTQSTPISPSFGPEDQLLPTHHVMTDIQLSPHVFVPIIPSGIGNVRLFSPALCHGENGNQYPEDGQHSKKTSPHALEAEKRLANHVHDLSEFAQQFCDISHNSQKSIFDEPNGDDEAVLKSLLVTVNQKTIDPLRSPDASSTELNADIVHSPKSQYLRATEASNGLIPSEEEIDDEIDQSFESMSEASPESTREKSPVVPCIQNFSPFSALREPRQPGFHSSAIQNKYSTSTPSQLTPVSELPWPLYNHLPSSPFPTGVPETEQLDAFIPRVPAQTLLHSSHDGSVPVFSLINSNRDDSAMEASPNTDRTQAPQPRVNPPPRPHISLDEDN